MRQMIELNRNWRFHLGEAENASYKGYDDRAWRTICLPHDWSVELPFDQACSSGTGYLPGGVGWYRTTFTLPEDISGKHVSISFGGVYHNSRCYLNSHYLGMRPYGYSSFTYDVTGRAVPGENVLCVRAEHLHLADSRWFTGAGIYRGVTLTLTDAAHVRDVYARTIQLRDGWAQIAVDAALSIGTLQVSLRNAQGDTVASAAAVTQTGSTVKALLTVQNPSLWSPETPTLYTLCCTVTNHGQQTDALHIPFGVRVCRFDPEQGFFLNDVSCKLKGVCLHHDAGVLGAAVPQSVWKTRFEKLMAAGCNAVRFSHNPTDAGVLDLCDQLGLLVIDEAFDEWEGCKNKWWRGHNVNPPKHYGYADDFPQWYEKDLQDMVRRDRNHACVILWSIGNEVDYPNDPYVHEAFQSMTGNNDANKAAEDRRHDPNRPHASRLPQIALELVRIVRQLDPSRAVTTALAYPALSNLTGLSDTVDVAGYNYMEARYAQDHAAYPARVILGTENSTTADAWLAVKHLPYVAGQFIWTGADFLGEAQGWPIRVSQAGLLTTANHEKPLYYHRRALWRETLCAKLAASLTGNTADEDFGWRYTPGESVTVSCYTNAAQATLYLNGKALGVAPVGEDARAVWTLAFEAGELRVVCARGIDTVEDRLLTAGEPVVLSLQCSCETLPADGQSIAAVEIRILDAAGQLVTHADEPVTVQMIGDITLLGIENGNPQDMTMFASHARPTWRGRAVAYLRAGDMPGLVEIAAWTRSGLKATLRLPQQPISG